jgi:hypothetical protein
MNKNVFINYAIGGVATDIYTVSLSSEDASYGVRVHGTSDVVVADGTLVWQSGSGPDDDRISTGVYQYAITVSPDIIYDVSWEIIPTSGGEPIFVVQQIGPFADPTSTFNGFADVRGTFEVGTYGTLCLRTVELDGTSIDPEIITVQVVQHSNSTTVFTETPEQIKSGLYVYEWAISSDPGLYDVYWNFTVRGVARTVTTQIVVAANGTGTADDNSFYTFLRIAFENMIPLIQAVPILHEQAKPSSDNINYTFTFKSWNQAAAPNVYRNDALITSGFEIDYIRGAIVFDQAQLDEDVIYADYNFRFFDDDKSRLFLENGIQRFNLCAPFTRFTLNNLPDKVVPAVLNEAAVYAYRVFKAALFWPQYRVLFGSSKLADKVIDQLDLEQKSYAEDFKDDCDRKKLFPYAGLTRLVIHPQFNLPGGRARFFRSMFGNGGM